jgi:hypothetical protein
MYRNHIGYKNIALFSLQMFADIMKYNIQNNHQIITTIKYTINSLIKKQYILKLYDLHYNELPADYSIQNKDSLFYAELIVPPKDHYFGIFDSELNDIFEYLEGTRFNKFNIIRYFIACRRVSNNDSNFGYLSQTKLKSLVNDSRTIKKYNTILQDDLQLIIYDNNWFTPDKHYCTTYIGNYGDRANFDHQVQFEVDRLGLVHTDKINSNKKRSVKQKINNIRDEPNKDKARIKELEEKLKEYEKLQYKEKVKEKASETKPKRKGLSKTGKKRAATDDSDFIAEMGWDIGIEKDDSHEFTD